MDGSGNLAIDYRPVEALIPDARNATTHSEAQVALIAGSIREYGFTNPVLVDGENGIIAGHGRVMAARTLGLARVGALSRRRGLCLAWRPACYHGGREPRRLRLCHPKPDHLGQRAAGPLPRGLSLAA